MKLNRLPLIIPLLMAFLIAALMAFVIGVGTRNAWGIAFVQCPGDLNGDADWDDPGDVQPAKTRCMHITGGDGFITMADGRELYIFSFSDVTGIDPATVLDVGVFRANEPAPTLTVDEGDVFYLTLTNVGTFNRPDLFDPHTVHYHGFPNASDIFDGVPDSTISINQQASLTYWYNNVLPGTYMWHCHVEATEHMQMGMLGNLNVRPAQNKLTDPTDLNGFTHHTGYQYVYNDGDGSTYYDVEYPIMLSAMDGDFHDQSRDTQPLQFAAMTDQYPMMNGRGYPDTTLAAGLYPPIPADSTANPPQPVGSLIEANHGDKILLRFINLGVVQEYTVTALGLPMKVVGRGARLLRGAGQAVGQNVFVETSTVTLGGGESTDVIIDTSLVPAPGITPDTYFLYTTNLNYLSNFEEDFGGMMTEIVIH